MSKNIVEKIINKNKSETTKERIEELINIDTYSYNFCKKCYSITGRGEVCNKCKDPDVMDSITFDLLLEYINKT